jgi:uridylate kinase
VLLLVLPGTAIDLGWCQQRFEIPVYVVTMSTRCASWYGKPCFSCDGAALLCCSTSNRGHLIMLSHTIMHVTTTKPSAQLIARTAAELSSSESVDKHLGSKVLQTASLAHTYGTCAAPFIINRKENIGVNRTRTGQNLGKVKRQQETGRQQSTR